MAYLVNDPDDFADELLEGFASAYPDRVIAVPGGVVRATVVPAGQVAVVIGGGSGHYPAFAGLVGPGLAHGAALGNLFASPSAQQIYTVAKAADAGGGILLAYGNYAGDVLNFTQAQERLIAEGIPCRTVVVTDDIASASVGDEAKRRGIAGDLAVFKVAAAAAESGASLEAVWRSAMRANERTRSLGVAFSGLTLPGASEPLFTVPPGRMAVGMGIHGEPGISEVAVPTADGLAHMLVDALLAERPASTQGARVAVVLNGLGSVKYEELFVAYRSIAHRLIDAGCSIVEPDIGEFCTSFQMAGVSLTLMWLDDELEAAWVAPADSAAYRKGTMRARASRAPDEIAAAVAPHIPAASEASRAGAARMVAALSAISSTIEAIADELGGLDAVAGDGDHGIGMQRGARAALIAGRSAEDAGAGGGTVLRLAGDAWAFRAGGTSGALWGLILRAIGGAIGDDLSADAASVSAGVTDAESEVVRYGKAERGDKTMLDALGPFADALATRVALGERLHEAWAASSEVATAAALATATLLPRIGRARPHAERSIGTPDPGAVSMAAIIAAIAELLSDKT